MIQVGNITLETGNSLPILFDKENRPVASKMKIYHDGSHYCAGYIYQNKVEPKTVRICSTNKYKELYIAARKEGLKGKDLHFFIKENIGDCTDDFVAEKIKKVRHNLRAKLKRFKRKAYLNKWNYFVTFTYDNEKQTEESFRLKLRRCLSNLKTRRGWRFMGVFEQAPDTNRLHFHCLMYVPAGEMIGKIEEKKDYSFNRHTMQIYHENSFFARRFGRNDFVFIDDLSLRISGYIDYILKYIDKSGERMIASRGVFGEIVKEIFPGDIAASFYEFFEKFVLFDDVVDYERDILKFKPIQLKMSLRL